MLQKDCLERYNEFVMFLTLVERLVGKSGSYIFLKRVLKMAVPQQLTLSTLKTKAV
jgi:hypothetical protein